MPAKPASGASDPVLLCNNPVCSLLIHHCLVWTGHQTGQDQIPLDSLDCRENYPELIHVQSQETGRKHHCRPVTPWTQPVPCPLLEVLKNINTFSSYRPQISQSHIESKTIPVQSCNSKYPLYQQILYL